MRREVHVRFCERLAVTFRGPTLPGFWSGGKIGHQLCEKFETGKLDGVNLQSTSADEAQNAGDALWRLDAARATPK